MPRRKDDQPGQRLKLTSEQFGEQTKQQILDFVGEYTAEHGEPPKIREVADGIERAYKNARRYIKELVAEGRLYKDPAIQRSLRVIPKGEHDHRTQQG